MFPMPHTVTVTAGAMATGTDNGSRLTHPGPGSSVRAFVQPTTSDESDEGTVTTDLRMFTTVEVPVTSKVTYAGMVWEVTGSLLWDSGRVRYWEATLSRVRSTTRFRPDIGGV